MRDPTAALLYAVMALREAEVPATPQTLGRLAEVLALPEPDPLLLSVIAALGSGGRAAPLVARPPESLAEPAASTVQAPAPDPPASSVDPAPAAGTPAPSPESQGEARGLYVYGIVRATSAPPPGDWTGIDGARVEVVEAGEFALLVHTHTSEPYASDEADVVYRWVREHDAVLARAADAFGDVLPMAFDTIIAQDGKNPVELARAWVQEQAPQLRAGFQRIAGAREYTVQVFWDLEEVRRHLVESDPELQRLQKEAEAPGSAGKAYFLRERMRKETDRVLEERTGERVQAYRRLLSEHVRELRLDAPRKSDTEGSRMIANFSCLFAPEDEGALTAALDTMEAPGESIRLAGPWAPYSFANAPAAAGAAASREG